MKGIIRSLRIEGFDLIAVLKMDVEDESRSAFRDISSESYHFDMIIIIRKIKECCHNNDNYDNDGKKRIPIHRMDIG